MRSKRWVQVVAVAAPLMTGALVLAPTGAAAPLAGVGPRTGAAHRTGVAPTTDWAPLTAAEAATLSSQRATDRVIIVLRDRLASTSVAPAAVREDAAATAQRSVLAELHATGAQRVKGLSLVDDVVATVPAGEAARLRADPDVAEVVTDREIRMAAPTPAPATRTARSAAGFKVPAGTCASGKTVQLDPEAIEAIHAATQSGKGDSAQALGYTGAGVKVGFIADGIDTDNPDFIRANGSHVFVGYQDFSNSGTGSVTSGGEAFLDASSIAAQGRHVYNLENYGTGLAQKCDIRILGVAPGASLTDLDTFGNSDDNFTSALLEAVDYGVTHDHLNVINESFGDDPFPDVASLDLVEQADSAAVARGVTVTASSGDAGPTNTIDSPASDPDVISAGATTTFRSYLQTNLVGAAGGPVKVTGWESNNISGLSSGGVSQSERTVDVVAPGDLNWALCSPYPKRYTACTNFAGKPASIELSGGTSEAAPLTAGTAALVIQAYREAHGGHSPTPAVVRRIITSTAENIGAPGDRQGAGMIDAYAAVLAARSFAGTRVPRSGHAVLTGTSQLTTAGVPGTSETLRDTLTNDGRGPVTVDLSSRVLGPYADVRTTVVDVGSKAKPSALEHFTVPAGEARLSVRLSDHGAVNLTLVNPGGKLAAYSLLQGETKNTLAEVTDPAAGSWTAVLQGTSSPPTVQFAAQVAQWVPLGTLSTPAVTLRPGATVPFTLTVPTPAAPGDEAGSIILHSRAGGPAFTTTTSVPVVLRADVPTPAPTTSFTGTLTGGNGRISDVGQSAYYDVLVPAGTGSLSAEVGTANTANTFFAELISPSGIAASTSGATLLTENAKGKQTLDNELGTQLHVLAPTAGVWTLAINFYDNVSGTALTQPFSVSLSTTPAAVTAPGLPDSPGSALPAGVATTVDVTVTNSGATPEAYFVDGRLDTVTTVKLAPRTTALVHLPDLGATTATYLVPSDTTKVGASVTAKKAAIFDFAYIFGDPDIITGAAGSTVHPTGTFSGGASGVPPGVWAVVPFLKGPDGVAGIKPASVRTAMTATTKAFDPAVSSPTGDLWRTAVDPKVAVAPDIIAPGQSVTIPVTITPSAKVGTTVTGVLYVDDDSSIAGEAGNTLLPVGTVLEGGSQLAALPYEYTVSAP